MSKRILIVDDDPAIRESVRKVLQAAGYCATAARDGQEAAERLTDENFDLLLLDLDLPRISGWDVLELVNANWPLLPVIILTAFGQQCEPGAAWGADLVLEKPPDVGALLQNITRLLEETPEARSRRVPAPFRANTSNGYLRLGSPPESPRTQARKTVCG